MKDTFSMEICALAKTCYHTGFVVGMENPHFRHSHLIGHRAGFVGTVLEWTDLQGATTSLLGIDSMPTGAKTCQQTQPSVAQLPELLLH